MAAANRKDVPGRSTLYTWNLLTSDTVGESISHPGSSDRTVQFIATQAGSATAILEGSNALPDVADADATWFTLTDGQGNSISFTASGGEMVAENILRYRPRLSIAGSGADWIITLLSRSTMR